MALILTGLAVFVGTALASADEPVATASNGPAEAYFDLDGYFAQLAAAWPSGESRCGPGTACQPPQACSQGDWLGISGAFCLARGQAPQLLPVGLIYRPYLASTKESRLGTQIIYERDDGWLFDNTLGAQFGLLRWGTTDVQFPLGVQIDAEGSAQLRLDIPHEVDLRSGDYRAGMPITFGYGRHRTKLAYYHLSSHVGDEFLLRNPGFMRLNYSRDALVLGHAYYFSPSMRGYAEADWAFRSDVSEPWQFQFGLDYAPARGTGPGGSPFLAVNGHLRQEVDFGGGLTAQAGWSWRSHHSGRLLRIGAHYYNGKSTQYSFFDEHEHQIGFGVWLDN